MVGYLYRGNSVTHSTDCLLFFFFKGTATTEIYTLHIVGSVRCAYETVTSDTKVKLPQIVSEAEFPWGIVFLPNGDLLSTEKEGGLKRVPGGEGTPVPVTGLPPAYT